MKPDISSASLYPQTRADDRTHGHVHSPVPIVEYDDGHSSELGDIVRADRLTPTTAAGIRSMEDIAKGILHFGIEMIGASRGCVARVIDHRVTVVAASGYSEHMYAHVMAMTEATHVPMVDAALIGEPVWLENADEYVARYPWGFDAINVANGTQAHAAVPLIYRSEVVGCLEFGFSTPRSFSTFDRDLMLLLARVASAALFRAHFRAR